MSRRDLGRRAEQFVADALTARGWRILGRNLRTPYAEVDLLALEPGGAWVVVEVKARHPLGFLREEDHLGPRQRRRLEAALQCLAEGTRRRLRLDLAVVQQAGGQFLGWELLEGLAVVEAA
jgi:putative endonuclease